MIGQLDLFDLAAVTPVAVARATDPETSHAAAASVTPTLNRLHSMLLAHFIDAGTRGFTSFELAEHTGVPHVTVSSRLRPMERLGLIVATDETRLGPSGRRSIVWVTKTDKGSKT
jgi:DNA-directed RNA polymerase specialized sigma24 family protein